MDEGQLRLILTLKYLPLNDGDVSWLPAGAREIYNKRMRILYNESLDSGGSVKLTRDEVYAMRSRAVIDAMAQYHLNIAIPP